MLQHAISEKPLWSLKSIKTFFRCLLCRARFSNRSSGFFVIKYFSAVQNWPLKISRKIVKSVLDQSILQRAMFVSLWAVVVIGDSTCLATIILNHLLRCKKQWKIYLCKSQTRPFLEYLSVPLSSWSLKKTQFNF